MRGTTPGLEPLQHVLVKSVESALYLLWGGAVFVLLIGGLNVTNLALARSSARSKEIATRLALGAGRAQIARQTIVENVLLAGAGGIAGVLRGVTLVLGAVALAACAAPAGRATRVDPIEVLRQE